MEEEVLGMTPKKIGQEAEKLYKEKGRKYQSSFPGGNSLRMKKRAHTPRTSQKHPDANRQTVQDYTNRVARREGGFGDVAWGKRRRYRMNAIMRRRTAGARSDLLNNL